MSTLKTAIRFTVALACICVEPNRVLAQARAGAPASSVPGAKNETPHVLPIQSYIAIDMGGGDATKPVMDINLDENGDAVFSTSWWGDASVSNDGADFVVNKFSHGQFSELQRVRKYGPPIASLWQDRRYVYLRPDGTIVGDFTDRYPSGFEIPDPGDPPPPIDPEKYEGFESGTFTAQNSACIYNYCPNPFSDLWPWGTPIGATFPGCRFLSNASDHAYVVSSLYAGINPPGQDPVMVTPNGSADAVGDGVVLALICDSGNTYFSPDIPATVQDVPGMKFVRDDFWPVATSGRGAALDSRKDRWWDGQYIRPTGIAQSDWIVDWTSSNWTNENRAKLLIGANRDDGAIWDNGLVVHFKDIIANKPWTPQLTHIVPLMISNENKQDHGYQVVTALKDRGVDKLVLWKNILPPVKPGESPVPRKWELSEMILPENVHINSGNFRVINSRGVIAAIGNAGHGDGHALLLVPVGLINLADPAKLHNGADISIAFKQNDQDTRLSTVAWIAAHDPKHNNAPRMPRLQTECPAPPGCAVRWKLQVIFHDRNGKPHRDFDTGDPNDQSYSASITPDTVVIPNYGSNAPGYDSGWHKVTDGTPWTIADDEDWGKELAANGFFGGDAVLSLQVLAADGTTVLSPQTDYKFRIAGENPDEALCKQYICGQYGGPDVPTRTPPDNTWHEFWFAYAVAREETANEGGPRHYNQFNDNGTRTPRGSSPGNEGKPDWQDDKVETSRPTGTGGYGLFQHTYEEGDAYYYMPRAWIWNWQANVDGYRDKFNKKYAAGLTTYQGLRATFPHAPDLPNHGNFSGLECLVLTYINGGGGSTTYLRLTGVGRRLTCWNLRGTTWEFLPNGQKYVNKVNDEVNH